MEVTSQKARRTIQKWAAQSATLALVVLLAGVRAPVRSGSSSDSDADARANAILAKMTLEQKIDLLGGADGFFVRAVPEFGVPRLPMADGPIGVRNFGPSTAMAAGINLAATWDPALAQRVGMQIGRDARAKGVNFLLGPGVNIYRSPLNGRNFEYFGEDPFLAARIAVGYIDGVQSQGVSATAKHFAANNSEFDRHNTDSIIDERTLREIYLPVFEAAVKDAHVGAVMNSYNLVNGVHLTQNKLLDTEILKKEWGFQGVLMSDWSATYDGVAAANAGLDLEMPAGAFMNRANLLPAIHEGRVSIATIDDKVLRILRLAIKSHWLDRDQVDLSISRYNLEGREAALDASREGIVLLKNDANLLPLDKHTIKSIAVIGPDAFPAVPVGGGSAGVRPFVAVSLLEGIANELGPAVHTYYHRGIPRLDELAQNTSFSTAESGGAPGLAADYFSNEKLENEPILSRTDLHVNFGVVPGADLGPGPAYPSDAGSVRWTGYYNASGVAPCDFFVQSTGEAGGYYRLYVDGNLALDDWAISKALVDSTTINLTAGPHKIILEHHGRPGFLGSRFRFGIVRPGSYVDPASEKIAASADAVVLAVGFDPDSESEGSDRTFRLPPGQDELIQKIAAINKHVILVITSGGSVNMNDWVDRVPGILEDWYPGQEGGTALAQIVFGDVNPSGRLPVSFERQWEDNPVHNSYYPESGTKQVVYKEGIFVGYRGYEHNGIKPLFPFGYGLSYTTFRYRNLSIHPVDRATTKAGTPSQNALYEVSCDVTNTGSRDGADIAEVYVGESNPSVPRPPKELKGFARVSLHPGETQHVSVPLNARAFSYFDTVAHEWRVNPGEFTVFVGRSVEQIELKGAVTFTPAAAASASSKP